ncbi:MAG: GNAT family N-acetyltransferase [Bacteroidales bacterium]|nr:GNAT family N-acetyltransferase [Bacteroidales bacterium]
MQTDRILLRPWRESDAEMLFKYASDPDVGPRAGWPPHQSVEESMEIIRTVFNSDHIWAIELKETSEPIEHQEQNDARTDLTESQQRKDEGQPIGCIGYYTYGESNINIGKNDAEAGYWIAKPYWNRGICTEALQLLIDYCFSVKGFSTIWSDFFVDNPASGRVMEKCGFRDTGDINYCSHLQVGNDRPVKIMRLDAPKKERDPQ